ncbi:hypothetical protein APY03_5772 [Variovorax sp. WDL1]|nr:hypothetical protein APY03_5772 [Variovorax sp. WDL1]
MKGHREKAEVHGSKSPLRMKRMPFSAPLPWVSRTPGGTP